MNDVGLRADMNPAGLDLWNIFVV